MRYVWKTRKGIFSIVNVALGRWAVFFNDENLGTYHSAGAAHDDLLGDHCISNSAMLDTSNIGLPEDLSEWDKYI